jgi:hypothetical protein
MARLRRHAGHALIDILRPLAPEPAGGGGSGGGDARRGGPPPEGAR